MAQINVESGTGFSTAVLIADLVQTPKGSNDSTAQFTQVNGETASVAFEIQSDLGAALLPRVTTAVMNSFVAANGMIVYNTTAQAFYGYINGAWAALAYIGADIGLTQGLNIVLTPNPITSSGTIALSTTLTSLISVAVGNMTLSSSNINSTGSLIFGTNGSTTALTLNTSQNALFAAGVTIATTLTLSSSGGGSIVQQAPSIAGNFTYTWPTAYPVSSGYILSSTTGGVLSWILNEETTGTANTLAWFNASGILASNTNVTVDSSGDITTTATIQANILKAGNITLTGSTVESSGSLILATNGSTTALTINTSQNATFAGTVTSGNITLSASNVNSSGSLFFGTNGSTTALTLNTSQNALFAGTVTSGNLTLNSSTLESSGSLILATNGSTTALTLDTSQNATFVGNVILSGTKAVEAGSVILLSSGGGNIIQEAPVTASSFTYTWPSAYPVSNGYILSSTTAGVMSWILNEETTGTANTLAWFNASGVLASNTNVTVTSVGAITTTSTMKAGNITLTGSTVESSGSLILATNGSTTALTIDTSQNSVFAGSVQGNGFTSVGNITINESGSSGASYTLYFNNGTNQSYLAYQGGSVFTAFSGGVLNLSATTSTTFYTNNGTLALTLDTGQAATFHNNLFCPDNIYLTANNAGAGLYSAQAQSNSGGVFFDSATGDLRFAGGSTSSAWGIFDSSSNLIFRVFSSGAAATLSINNGTFESSGSLVLATNGSTTALTLNTSQNATFANLINVPTNINMTSGSSTNGLYSSNATANNGGLYLDALNGNLSFKGGTSSNTWNVFGSTGNQLFYIFNVGSSTNSIGVSAGNLVLQSNQAIQLTAPTSGVTGYTLTFPAAAPTNAGFLNVPNSGTANWITGRCSFQAAVAIQTISANTSTNVNFGTSNYNLGGIITATSTNSQLQNTSGNTVTVLITYNIYWVSANSYPCAVFSYIGVNGLSTAQYGSDFADFDISGKPLSTQGTYILTMANNDYINIVVSQNSSGNAFLNDAANLCYVQIWQLA